LSSDHDVANLIYRIEGEWWFDIRMILVDLIGNMSEHLSFDLRHESAPRV